ncbi:MAG: hypothetical protein WA962_14755 [Ornithinimicrobium sp.]
MSPATRMYFPLAPAHVAELHARGRLEAGLRAFAVTDAIRAAEPEADEELWEFLALQDAASCARTAGGPVVVAAADIADPSGDTMSSDPTRGVLTTIPLLLADVASLHLGDDALGSSGPSAAQHRDDEHIELSWFDTTELAQVVRYLSPPEETAPWTQ